MKRKPTLAGLAAVCFIAAMFVLMMVVEGWPAVGNKCNWASDCGLNETCRTLPYYQRDGSSYNGICVPKEW